MRLPLHRLLFFLSLLALVQLSSFAQENSAQQKPDFKVKSVKLNGIDWSNKTADTTVVVVVSNPGIGFKLTDLQYKLKMNDSSFAEGKYDKEAQIPSKGEAEIELPFTIDLTTLPLVAWNSIKESLTLHYEIEAEFKIPLLTLFSPTQKTSFKGDFSLTDALAELPAKIREKIFH
jgi:LEA14-like dessication related protein